MPAYDDGRVAALTQDFCPCGHCLARLHGYAAYQTHVYRSGFYNERQKSDSLNAAWSIMPENCPDCPTQYDPDQSVLIPGVLMCLRCQCRAVLTPRLASALHIEAWSQIGGPCVVCNFAKRQVKKRK